ncbi:UNVERIFIED_CONTAM: hypothetical protein PYX00_004803 [Menopon gallinae]|uniref:Uncharacterized protein n=1 Tax=Menopon gallinae TaxID=328185 RepID=A0AAW2I5U9_9NEOP
MKGGRVNGQEKGIFGDFKSQEKKERKAPEQRLKGFSWGESYFCDCKKLATDEKLWTYPEPQAAADAPPPSARKIKTNLEGFSRGLGRIYLKRLSVCGNDGTTVVCTHRADRPDPGDLQRSRVEGPTSGLGINALLLAPVVFYPPEIGSHLRHFSLFSH